MSYSLIDRSFNSVGTSFPLARILLVVEPDANDASDLLVDGDGSEACEDDEVKDSTISKRMCHMSLR